jgi:hypothetical protein
VRKGRWLKSQPRSVLALLRPFHGAAQLGQMRNGLRRRLTSAEQLGQHPFLFEDRDLRFGEAKMFTCLIGKTLNGGASAHWVCSLR